VIDKDTRDGLLLLTTTSISSSIAHMLEVGGTDAVSTASLQNQLDAVQVLANRRANAFQESELYQNAIISILEMVSFAQLMDPRPSDGLLQAAGSILESLESLTSSDAFQKRASTHLNDLLDDLSVHLE